MKKRLGYKQSLVMKHGIRIFPVVAKPRPGTYTEWFHIKVTKISKKTGQEIEVKQKNPKLYYYKEYVTYETPPNGKRKRVVYPSVWEKIDDIYDYYYKKLS